MQTNVHTDAPATRARAGKALLIFLCVMAALTMLNNTLQEMVLPLVTPTLAQRGALEQQVNANGTLAAMATLPIGTSEAARASEILVKTGARVHKGDALMIVDYSDVLKEKHRALIDALNTASQKEQAYLWAKSDLDSKSKEKTVEKRRSELEDAENALAEARQTLLAVIEADKATEDAGSIETAERAVRTAQSNVSAKRNRLGSLTKSREFITASSDLAVAQEALNVARRAFFDVCAVLESPDVDCTDEERIIQVALAQIGFGGGSTDQLPFDSNKAYTGVVRAPVDGEMISIDVKAGELISTDKPAMTIGDLRQGLSLTVTVGEDEAELMAVGDRAEISVGDDRFECAIASIRVSADEADKYEVEFAIPQGYGSVGLRGSMSYKKRTQNYDLLIPLGALRQDNEGDFVYLVQQQDGSLGASMSVVRTSVYVLEKDNTRAALQGGVTQRDILALRSDRDIQDGDRVRLQED